MNTGDIGYAGPGINPVLHVVDSANFAVFNITQRGHMFQDGYGAGYVYRNVQTDSRGVFVQTYGAGNGPIPGFNTAWVTMGGWQWVDRNIRQWFSHTSR